MSGKQILDPARCRENLWRSPLYELGDLMIGTVPAADFHEAVSRLHIVAIRSRSHIAVQQRIR